MKIPLQKTATITGLSHEGRGIAHIDGKITFIDNALPGEEVLFIYTKRRGKLDEGETVKVLKASESRVEPPCPHTEICGGCSLQHVSPKEQQALKEKSLLEQLKHLSGALPQHVLPPLEGPAWHYRRRARLGMKYLSQKDQFFLGFRQKNGRFLADLKSCHILDERVARHFGALKEMLSQLEARAAIPQLEVACGDNACALVLRHLQPLSETDISRIKTFAAEHDFWWYLQPGGMDSIHRIYPETGSSDEMLFYDLPDYDVRIPFHPADFTQVNAEINRKMVKQALQYLDLQPHEQALDLFCGLGNFSFAMAQQAASVTAIEGDTAMVARAQAYADAKGVANLTFHMANLSAESPLKAFRHLKVDKILLDPPRTGALEVVNDLSAFGAKRIVYVACNPATLARDAAVLIRQGYTMTHAGILDMFPHTRHVESMAVFDKVLLDK